ncbi:MAG TPA: lipoprotein insertase outer membrane protein LolB [Steroidobacteraceae bacterium]|nr:lipoprotein insertase outer membrane protein LolB [Steroidobacteraceae bacterium]
MQRQLSVAFLASVVMLASGCATTPRPTGAPPSIDLQRLDRWQASGRLGVSGPENGGSGSFDWQQRGDRTEVQIRGPVGIGSVHLQLRGDPANPQLQLETGNGRKLESDAAWNELEARLGAAVPAGNLRYWMLGLAAPGEHVWHEPAADGVVTLEQGGWRIDYQRYSTEPGARVPVKLSASNGAARVRIVVDRWRLGQ